MLAASWALLADSIPPYHLYVTGTLFLHVIVFWPLCLALMNLDITHSPAFLYKYKIQTKKQHGWESYKKTIVQALLNLSVAACLATFLFYFTDYIDYRMSFSKELPSPITVLFHFIGFVLIEEIGFFYSHYAFHNRYLYKKIHSFHHRFTAPVGMACVYAHPIEHIVANLGPLLLGPILMRAHVLELWLWMTIGIINTINGHSGYEFPLTSSALPHDFHHEAFKYNFGALGILDWLHGTKGQSRKTIKK